MKIKYANEGSEIESDTIQKLTSIDYRTTNRKGKNKYYLNFTGIVMNGEELFVSFPKRFKVNKLTIDKDVKLLFNTIIRHYLDNQNLYLEQDVILKTNFPFTAFYAIYGYYKRYGIYKEEIRHTKLGYCGAVSWKETIEKSPKLVSNQGLVFMPLHVKVSKSEEVLISECMIYAIDSTIKKFSTLLKLEGTGREFINTEMFRNTEQILRKLYSLNKRVFKDIHKELLRNLIDFFKNQATSACFFIKHYTFSNVWEKMVENYLNNHFVKIDKGLVFDESSTCRNRFTKMVFYPDSMNPSHYIQPDHYLEKADCRYVFDSKYYNDIKGVDYKQIAYCFMLSQFNGGDRNEETRVNSVRTYGALILPGDKPQRIHFSLAPNYQRLGLECVIYECYLSCKKVMKQYISDNSS